MGSWPCELLHGHLSPVNSIIYFPEACLGLLSISVHVVGYNLVHCHLTPTLHVLAVAIEVSLAFLTACDYKRVTRRELDPSLLSDLTRAVKSDLADHLLH